MKNYPRKYLIFILFLLLISTNSFAQGPCDPGKDPNDSNINVVSTISANSPHSLAGDFPEIPEISRINKNKTYKILNFDQQITSAIHFQYFYVFLGMITNLKYYNRFLNTESLYLVEKLMKRKII